MPLNPRQRRPPAGSICNPPCARDLCACAMAMDPNFMSQIVSQFETLNSNIAAVNSNIGKVHENLQGQITEGAEANLTAFNTLNENVSAVNNNVTQLHQGFMQLQTDMITRIDKIEKRQEEDYDALTQLLMSQTKVIQQSSEKVTSEVSNSVAAIAKDAGKKKGGGSSGGGGVTVPPPRHTYVAGYNA